MNLRHRLGLISIIGLVLCLALLGRELLRPKDAEPPPPARTENVAAVAVAPAPSAPPTIAPSAPELTPVANVSSSGGIFRGRVIDAATRQPVREFELEFYPLHQPAPGDQAPGKRTIRSKDGRFELQGIPPRLWMVTASARGYQRFDIAQLQISADAATEADIPLQRGHALRGRVYDETSGAGIAAAYISFREANIGRYEGNFRHRVNTRSNKDGSFVLDGVPRGGIILSVNAAKYVGREIDVFIGEKTGPLQIALSSGAAITGHMVAADGLTPVAGSVSLVKPEGGAGISIRTSDAGEFSFERLSPGIYRLSGLSGSLSSGRDLSLAKDERKEGVVLVLNGGHSIRGVIKGVRPADMERVQVAVFHDNSFRDPQRTGVDARGAYEIQGVEAGSVRVTASLKTGLQLSKALQMPEGADLVADFDFPPGSRLTGNVTRGGKPLSRTVIEPRGLNEQSLFMDGVRTSDNGEYVMEGVPNGEYFMQLGSYRSRNFTVLGDTVFDIDVPVAELTGRTVEEGGKVPVVGADVDLWSLQAEATRMQWRSRADHFGEFTIVGLAPGEYMLSAYKPGYEMYRERISHNSAASRSITIPMRQGRGVEIRLREAGSGRPVRNAQLTEMIDGRPGTGIRLRLDENGMGYLPRALVGSTLTFKANSYVPAVVSSWGGQELDVQLERNQPR